MSSRPLLFRRFARRAEASDAAVVKDTARCNALPSEIWEQPNYVDRLRTPLSRLTAVRQT